MVSARGINVLKFNLGSVICGTVGVTGLVSAGNENRQNNCIENYGLAT